MVTSLAVMPSLGAEPRALKWLFVRHGLTLNCIGGIIGLALALGLSRWIASLLFGLTPLDPLTYAAAGGLIALAATAASYVPARQAASMDPMETLRSE
jgi:ABC-type lipoprotein release transport system permease subunit